MAKGLILTVWPFADLLAEEVSCLLGRRVEGTRGSDQVILDASIPELYRIAYHSHLAHDVLCYGDTLPKGAPASAWEESVARFASSLPHPGRQYTFRVTAPGSLIEEYSGAIVRALAAEGKVRLKGFGREYVLVEGKDGIAYGVRLYAELSKREYRVHTLQGTIKASLAYAMTALMPDASVIVDPYLRDGIILIERALAGQRPLRYHERDLIAEHAMRAFGLPLTLDDSVRERQPTLYGATEQMADLHKAKANAKIAGVHKAIDFSRREVGWLDYKFGKGAVDLIATLPPLVSKHVPERHLAPFYKELFYQAAYVLRAKGRIILYANEKTRDFLSSHLPFETVPLQEGFSLLLITKQAATKAKPF